MSYYIVKYGEVARYLLSTREGVDEGLYCMGAGIRRAQVFSTYSQAQWAVEDWSNRFYASARRTPLHIIPAPDGMHP